MKEFKRKKRNVTTAFRIYEIPTFTDKGKCNRDTKYVLCTK
jgi:hypothetical protein